MSNYLPEPAFVMLPNGDLHRGWRENSERPDNGSIADLTPDPVNDAMSKILLAAKGARTLTCIWCGVQSSDPKAMREHVETLHVQVAKPLSDKDIAEIALMQAEQNKVNAE